jgi:hypothetical protein
MLSPDADNLARAAAAKSGNDVFPSGALAANMLGLSTQVPAKPVYMTNGPSRSKTIAGRVITLKHARVPLFDNLSTNANLALQALSYLGKGSIDDKVIRLCADKMTDRDLRDLASATDQVPGWVAGYILKMQQAKYGQIRN